MAQRLAALQAQQVMHSKTAGHSRLLPGLLDPLPPARPCALQSSTLMQLLGLRQEQLRLRQEQLLALQV